MTRILLLQLEFRRWNRAKAWSYAQGLGLVEGMTKAGVNITTVTTPWLPHIPDGIFKISHFDQIWIESCHQPQLCGGWTQAFLEWLSNAAPVRVGLVFESLSYSQEELAVASSLSRLSNSFAGIAKHLTHACMADEVDVDRAQNSFPLKALWMPCFIPERFIVDTPAVKSDLPAVFYGTLYKKRAQLVSQPELRDVVTHSQQSAGKLDSPLFDAVNLLLAPVFDQANLRKRRPVVCRLLEMYAEIVLVRIAQLIPAFPAFHSRMLRIVRVGSFRRWLKLLSKSAAVVSLPSYFKSYPGRIIEAMGAGVPVVAARVKDRPRTDQLFRHGKELMLYDEDNSAQLADCIKMIKGDPAFAMTLATSARKRVLAYHTCEKRVTQILRWIEAGVEPDYW